MKIAVASCNPVKIGAVQDAFLTCFSGVDGVEGFSVPSGVPDQPIGDEMTRQGAENRVHELKTNYPSYDCFVGIEGGIMERNGQIEAFAWVIIHSATQAGEARTASFCLPSPVVKLLKQGYELGDANDQVFKEHNSKQKGGAVGLLTRNKVDRRQLYSQAVILALVPFMNENLYV